LLPTMLPKKASHGYAVQCTHLAPAAKFGSLDIRMFSWMQGSEQE
jgi:hypothetical protein